MKADKSYLSSVSRFGVRILFCALALASLTHNASRAIEASPASSPASASKGEPLALPAAPKPLAKGAALDPFDKQFRKDTGENEFTRRVEINRARQARTESKERFSYHFDLSAWPESTRNLARVWLAIGASSALSSEGTIGVNFTQNGVGMTTQLDRTFDVDGTMVLGSDFALSDGEVSMEVDRLGHPPGTPFTVRAIVYIPRKNDPSPAK